MPLTSRIQIYILKECISGLFLVLGVLLIAILMIDVVEQLRTVGGDVSLSLLGALRRDGLLQQHKFALNVNYPNVSEGKKAKKPKWVSVADGVYSYHVYEKQPDGSYAVSFKPCEGVPACEITRTDADKIWAVDRNHITIAPINWDRTYGYPVDGRRELAKVKAFVEKRAPRP